MTIQALRIGSAVSDDASDFIVFTTGQLAADYDTLESPSGTNYQVTAGKTLYIVKIQFIPAGANGKITLSYGDDAVDASATPPTNEVVLIDQLWGLTAGVVYEWDVLAAIPAAKYPCIYNATDTCVTNIWGYEI